jgi:molybdate transport system ATP-binding protein
MARAVTGYRVVCHRASLVLGGRTVLGPINLDIAAGSQVLLLGPNGAGKTQLLKLLGAERWPTPTESGDEYRDYYSGEGAPLDTSEVLPHIEFIGGERQDKYYRYDWNFTVQRVVSTGVHNTARPIVRLKPAERARVRALLKRFALERLARRRFLTLSYGERRRVLIARALAGQPALILLDEVHNGLDAQTRRVLDRELCRLASRGTTLVMAAHRADDVPQVFARAVVLLDGQIQYDGPVSQAPQHWLAVEGSGMPTALPRGPTHKLPLIELRDAWLYRDYRPIIRGLDWTVRAGEHWAIVGANGSGKSTLLQAVYGVLPFAARGSVSRRGYELGIHIEEWRRRLGFVSPELQSEYLDDLSVENFVVSGERLSFGLLQPPTAAERRRARAALDLVGFVGNRRDSVRVLSYGQRRLVLFARALVLTPEALLLDEPLTGLDAPFRAQVRGLLSSLAQSGVQLLIAAHHSSDLVPEIGCLLEIRDGQGHIRERKSVAKSPVERQSRIRR